MWFATISTLPPRASKRAVHARRRCSSARRSLRAPAPRERATALGSPRAGTRTSSSRCRRARASTRAPRAAPGPASGTVALARTARRRSSGAPQTQRPARRRAVGIGARVARLARDTGVVSVRKHAHAITGAQRFDRGVLHDDDQPHRCRAAPPLRRRGARSRPPRPPLPMTRAEDRADDQPDDVGVPAAADDSCRAIAADAWRRSRAPTPEREPPIRTGRSASTKPISTVCARIACAGAVDRRRRRQAARTGARRASHGDDGDGGAADHDFTRATLPNDSEYNAATRSRLTDVVLAAARADLERAERRGELAGALPVPVVREAVEQARAVRIAAAGRVDDRRRLRRADRARLPPSVWITEPSPPIVTTSASTRCAMSSSASPVRSHRSLPS